MHPLNRIVIKYNPIYDKILFVGQCNIKNLGWVDFTINEIEAKDVKLKVIQENLANSFDKLIERFEVFDNLNDGLSIIEAVDFSGEENKIEFEDDNSVYGNLKDE